MPSLLRRTRRHTTDSPIPEPALEQTPSAPAPSQMTVPEENQPEATEPPTEARSVSPHRIARTRISGVWVTVIVAAVGLVFLLIFIVQNLTRASVHFLGASGTFPMGVAMLLAAVVGALVVALFGTARVLQLRRTVRRNR
jgi:uncharacterized integral membrane protein